MGKQKEYGQTEIQLGFRLEGSDFAAAHPRRSLNWDMAIPDAETGRLIDSLIAYQQRSAVDVGRSREMFLQVPHQSPMDYYPASGDFPGRK